MEIDQQRQRFERYVAISFALHGLLFLSFELGTLLSPKAQVFEPTVMVDIVALPTQVKNNDQPPPDLSLPVKPNAPEPPPAPEVKAPEPKPEPKAVAEDDDQMALERKKAADAQKRAEAALKRMREQLKKQRQVEEKKDEKRKADLAAFEKKYRQAISGNQKNEGTSLTGQMQATLNAYVGAIIDIIRSNWALPTYLQGQQLAARIVIHIGANGRVVAMEFTRTSTNQLFDNAAEGAIRQSSFPPPPAEMATGLRKSGVEVKFPL